MPLAIRNGVTLHLQELGAAGSPVVMLHGLLVGSLATWYFTAAPALARRHRVLLYDLRGHGKSERAKAGYDLGTQVADLSAVLDAFTDAPVTLVGHSYGGVVALSLALAHPARVARLVLVEAPLPPSRLAELDSFRERSPEAMAAALPEALRDALGAGGRRAARLVDSLSFLTTGCTLLADLAREVDIDDARLAALGCPLATIYGTRSSCLPVGRRLARLLPGARSIELEGGHFLPVEAAGPLTSAIGQVVDG